MGFFGSLLGWDQSMGAVNAVLASHLIENSLPQERKLIAHRVAQIIQSVQHRLSLDAALESVSKESRVVQMNFVALACDSLSIPTPVPNNVWTIVDNPYRIGTQVNKIHIDMAVEALASQDVARVTWPGDSVKVDFKRMYYEGALSQS